MADTETAKLPIKAIYIGVRRLQSGKLADGFVPLESPKQSASLFERDRKSPSRVVGGTYEMTGTIEEGSIKTLAASGGSFIGRWSGDAELLIEWEAADDAAKQRDRERKLVERLKKEPKVAQEMATLRRVYHKLPFGDRTAFELMVLDEIRKMPR